jgi:hypothetical protein
MTARGTLSVAASPTTTSAVLHASSTSLKGPGSRTNPERASAPRSAVVNTRCTTWTLREPRSRRRKSPLSQKDLQIGGRLQAADGTRTHDLLHGKQTQIERRRSQISCTCLQSRPAARLKACLWIVVDYRGFKDRIRTQRWPRRRSPFMAVIFGPPLNTWRRARFARPRDVVCISAAGRCRGGRVSSGLLMERFGR